jgi:hypothetical protein
MDDTLIYYIIGDNGASAEGTINGAFNEMANFNGMAALETPEFMRAMDEFGSPASYNHYAVGWAHAMDTPFQWTKQVASHWGGTRNGTIVHWPQGHPASGGLREQFCHVIDVAPNRSSRRPACPSRSGQRRATVAHGGHEHVVQLQRGPGARTHDLQYFEMFGNRGIYYKGWSAVTKHRTPWVMVGQKMVAFDDDIWELYDGSKDWSQAHDLLKEQPGEATSAMLRKLQRLWLIEATKYNAIPLDDRQTERILPELAGRPTLIHGNTQMFFPGMGRLSELSVLNLKNKSHSITAEIVVPENGAEGVIVCQGANIGGWTLYANKGKLKYCYNWGGFKTFMVEAKDPLTTGQHQVRMEFAYDGGGLGKGGKATLYTDGKLVGEGRIDATLATIFSADDGTDVGEDSSRRTMARLAITTMARSWACSSRSPMTRTTTRSIPKTPSAPRSGGSKACHC